MNRLRSTPARHARRPFTDRGFAAVIRLHLRRFAERTCGATAVEFGLLLPILLLFLGGIVEGGLIFHTWGTVQHVSRQAARSFAVGQATKAQAETFIANKLRSGVGALVVTSSVTTSTGTNALENEVVVQVTVPGSELRKVLPFGLFAMTQMQSTVRVRLET